MDKWYLQLLLRKSKSQAQEVSLSQILSRSKVTISTAGHKAKTLKSSRRQSKRSQLLTLINHSLQITPLKVIRRLRKTTSQSRTTH